MMLQAAVLCLALNIFHEARNQPVVGQIAVSQVVLNRVASDKFPNDVCGVVRQAEYPNNDKSKLPTLNRCSFSWYCDGISDSISGDVDAYRWALILSNRIMSGEFADVTDGATHYHSTKVLPEWSHRKEKLVQIEDHIFYK